MTRKRDEPPAVRVYTVCDESRYLIVRNVPALGCGNELLKLFGSYGKIEEFKPMDGEDCEPFTDVYWIKFLLVSNARFAKKKLDEFVFLGNRLQVSYAPHFESLSDTKDKLEGRIKEVLARLNSGRLKGSSSQTPGAVKEPLVSPAPLQVNYISEGINFTQRGNEEIEGTSEMKDPLITKVSFNQDYFPTPSMNETVRLVREKLDKIKSSGERIEAEPALKKKRVDNRRRI
ncbi:PREDICTED: RNA-binding protein 48-like isoform X2 [Nelumbo nucifera]|uniref:RNA-binding protein 48 n=1 Tax=Nelumbo nucifera TaxID=4432 RepID=A0A1U8Q0F4_NELNU|nr:PREDICTED: RNA-binding protein 48-like isoform X2 [Nelumbo nucifera]